MIEMLRNLPQSCAGGISFMANRPAAYKQQHLLDAVQYWWDVADPPFTSTQEMFYDYTASSLDHVDYGDIMSFEDFQRCLYKLGIRRISDEGEDRYYVQLETHRPSDESVMRLRLANE